jgi:hypothetical protein
MLKKVDGSSYEVHGSSYRNDEETGDFLKILNVSTSIPLQEFVLQLSGVYHHLK